MRLIIEKDYSKLSKKAAYIVSREIERKPNLVFGLSTGNTPLGTYKELIKMYKEKEIDFSNVVTFNLDEYYGFSPENKQSYHYYMNENLFKHINISKNNIYIPDGEAKNIEDYCMYYDQKIEEYGGIDLQILGVGENGHIAFNEPNDKFYLGTHLTDLAENTIEANSRFFNSIDEVPRKAITMGMGSIMKAKKIILLANGKKKSHAINKLLKSKFVSPDFPLSILLLHRDVTIIVDRDACGEFIGVQFH